MNSSNTNKPVPTCQQVLTNGHYCKCPAMRTSALCYYHHRDLQRRRIFEQAREVKRGYDKHRESRPEDEFNSEIVESLFLPALDDRASIHVACTNLVRAVYCDHISLAKARIMMRAITEANLSLRRGSILSEYRQPVLEMDPEPIPALGDEDGCVLPEQRGLKQAIVEGRRANAERADAEIAAARARGESPAPRPLTREEEQAATVKAQRAAQNEAFEREFLQMCTDAEAAGLLTDTMRHQRSRIEAKRSSQVAQPPSAVKAPTAVTQPPSTLISRTVSGTARLQSCDTPPLLSPLSSRASHEGLLSDESRDHASAVAFGGSTGLQASEKQHHKNGASAPNPAQAREPVPQLRSKGTRLSAVPITTGA